MNPNATLVDPLLYDKINASTMVQILVQVAANTYNVSNYIYMGWLGKVGVAQVTSTYFFGGGYWGWTGVPLGALFINQTAPNQNTTYLYTYFWFDGVDYIIKQGQTFYYVVFHNRAVLFPFNYYTLHIVDNITQNMTLYQLISKAGWQVECQKGEITPPSVQGAVVNIRANQT